MRLRAIIPISSVLASIILLWAGLATFGVSAVHSQTSPSILLTSDRNKHDRAAETPADFSEQSPTIGVTLSHTSYLSIISQTPEPLFYDDFSDPTSGWPIDDTPEIRRSYQDGEYEILTRSPDYWAAATAPLTDLVDYSVEASMRRLIGTTSDYGLIFDFMDWDNFYIFATDPGGRWYAVVKIVTGNVEMIVPFTNSPYINQDNNSNHLKVERIGNQLDFYANGQYLIGADDTAFAGELGVGLYMESDSDAPAAVRYDNFVVWDLGNGTDNGENSRLHLGRSSAT